MPHYLHQIAYTSESWGALIAQPQDRIEVVRSAIEKLGGKIESAWFAFGEYDIVMITEMPNNVSAAGISIAFAGGGACKSVQTTPLLSRVSLLVGTAWVTVWERLATIQLRHVMNQHQMEPRNWIAFSGMAVLVGLTFLATKFVPHKGTTAVLCLWDFGFLSNGFFATIRPVRWLHFLGNPTSKPISPTVRRMIRCFGVFMFLVGAMLAINLAVNFSDYWNGLY